MTGAAACAYCSTGGVAPSEASCTTFSYSHASVANAKTPPNPSFEARLVPPWTTTNPYAPKLTWPYLGVRPTLAGVAADTGASGHPWVMSAQASPPSAAGEQRKNSALKPVAV